MLSVPWDIYNLVFLDEISFDNKVMFTEESSAGSLSFFCILGLNGMLDNFWTEGTFNRQKFLTIVEPLL